jgi:hypothetical protein
MSSIDSLPTAGANAGVDLGRRGRILPEAKAVQHLVDDDELVAAAAPAGTPGVGELLWADRLPLRGLGPLVGGSAKYA